MVMLRISIFFAGVTRMWATCCYCKDKGKNSPLKKIDSLSSCQGWHWQHDCAKIPWADDSNCDPAGFINQFPGVKEEFSECGFITHAGGTKLDAQIWKEEDAQILFEAENVKGANDKDNVAKLVRGKVMENVKEFRLSMFKEKLEPLTLGNSTTVAFEWAKDRKKIEVADTLLENCNKEACGDTESNKEICAEVKKRVNQAQEARQQVEKVEKALGAPSPRAWEEIIKLAKDRGESCTISKEEKCKIGRSPVTMESRLEQMRTVGYFPGKEDFPLDFLKEASFYKDVFQNAQAPDDEKLVLRVFEKMVQVCKGTKTCEEMRKENIKTHVVRRMDELAENFGKSPDAALQAWYLSENVKKQVTDHMLTAVDDYKLPILACDVEVERAHRDCDQKYMGGAAKVGTTIRDLTIQMLPEKAFKMLWNEPEECDAAKLCEKTCPMECVPLKRKFVLEFMPEVIDAWVDPKAEDMTEKKEKLSKKFNDEFESRWEDWKTKETKDVLDWFREVTNKDYTITSNDMVRAKKRVDYLKTFAPPEAVKRAEDLMETMKKADEPAKGAKRRTARRNLLRLLRRTIRRTLALQ